MLLFCDSFDHYATAEITQKWTSGVLTAGPNSIAIGAVGRNSTNGLRTTWADGNADVYVRKTVTPSGSTAIIGFALNASAFNGVDTNNPLLEIRDSGTAQISLRINSDGTLDVVRGTFNGTLLGTTSSGITAGAYSYIEFKVVLHASAGTYAVRVNGSTVLSGSGANTAGAGTTTWTEVQLITDGTAGAHRDTGTWDIDDLYVCDGSGSNNTDFLGAIRVKAIFPDGAGASTDFTPSVGANYENVDEASTDGDTTYNSETTVGDHDTYTFAALGIAGTVKAVQTNLMVRSAGAGSETIAPMVRIAITDYQGTSTGVSTSYTDKMQVYEVSPATSVAWTTTEIDGAEFGIKLVS